LLSLNKAILSRESNFDASTASTHLQQKVRKSGTSQEHSNLSHQNLRLFKNIGANVCPETRLVIVNGLGLVFDKDLWKKNNGKNKGISFVERISKKNKSADFSVDMNPFKLPCRYEDICTASHVMCRQYWGVMSPKRRDFHSKHALSPQAQTSSNGCLVLVYPPGNGYLSHQTGSSEYHH